jgi:spermidine synthase
MRANRAPGVLLALAAVCACGPRVLFRGESPAGFGTVYVVQEGRLRALRFGSPGAEDQSLYDPARPEREPVPYIRTALLALAYARRPARLLMIGLGGGSFVRHARRLAPHATQEVVEINPLVVRVCRRFFDLARRDRLAIHVMDGRRFVQRTAHRYDVVFLDAYDAVDYPRHLGTREFFTEARRILAPGGVVVANLSPNTDEMRDALLRTFGTVFPGFDCLAAGATTVAVGWSGTAPERDRIRRRARELDRRSGGRYGLAAALERRCARDLRRGRLLRDPRDP